MSETPRRYSAEELKRAADITREFASEYPGSAEPTVSIVHADTGESFDVERICRQAAEDGSRLEQMQQSLLALLVMDLGYTHDLKPTYGWTPMRHQFAWTEAVEGRADTEIQAESERMRQQNAEEEPQCEPQRQREVNDLRRFLVDATRERDKARQQLALLSSSAGRREETEGR